MLSWKKVLAPLALLCAAAPARAQIEPSRHFSKEYQLRAVETIVRISILFEHNGVQGSGVCVGFDGKHSYILTCAHVLQGADRAADTRLEFFTERSYPNPSAVHTASFQFWLDKENDLGLIKVAATVPSRIAISPGDAELKVNTPVLAVGCGKSAPPVAQVGKLIGRDPLNDFLVDRGAIGGRSGGALISNHGLVGILARASDDRTHAVNLWKIHAFLKKTGHARLLPASREPEAPASVAGTVWVGSEDLEGFGELTFQLQKDGTAVMIDSKSTVKGTWTQDGAQVVIRFANCAYTGRFNGGTLAGQGRFFADGQGRGEPWNFRVARK
jgi:hypothetical protein